jgi:hypothetical protein
MVQLPSQQAVAMLQHHIPEAERILEIPLYRCTQEQHWAEEERDFEARIAAPEVAFLAGGRTEERVTIWENYRAESHGSVVTLYDFNQIVGWIRLYAWPGKVRAYLFMPRERVSKALRCKTFETRRGNFVEFCVFPDNSNKEIFVKLKTRILAEVANHSRTRGLHVDLGVLNILGPHIDWVGLTQTQTQRHGSERHA